MRVGISALFIRPDNVGGVEPFFYDTLRALKCVNSQETFLLYCSPQLVPRLEALVLPDNFRICIVDASLANRFVVETLVLPALLKRDACEVVWFPNYYLPSTVKLPSVVTVHDLQYKHLPEMFSLAKRFWLEYAVARTAAKASELVTISQFSAADITDMFNRKPEVIYAAVHDQGLIRPPRTLYADREMRLLIVARQYRHKNISTAVRALGYLNENFHLDIVGQADTATDAVISAVAALRSGASATYHGYVERERLLDLYANCDLLLFPSRFEGFGIPVVEAMMRGIPVLMSDLKVLREVSLGLGYYVQDYLEPAAWAKAIASLRRQFLKEPPPEHSSILKNHFVAERIGQAYNRLFERAATSVGT